MDLKGKKVVFFGDSITQGVGASSPEKCYVSLFQAHHPEAEIVNCGISGTRFANQTDVPADDYLNVNRFTARVETLPEDADLVVVFGGTNDHGHGNAPLGKMGDTDDSTFYGAAHLLCMRLLKRYPKGEFLLLTPFHRNGECSPSIQGAMLADYVKAIRETAELFSIPVLDLYAVGGINPNIADQKATYMPDGIHPNDAGYERLYRRIDAFIRNFY